MKLAATVMALLMLSAGALATEQSLNLGMRPWLLVQDMDEGPLKSRLANCTMDALEPTEFSIGHRGAPLAHPEHTEQSYRAAARMGAGIIECDVTFTRDQELVCRHSQCDLHSSTNILQTELAERCREAFEPAQFDAAGELIRPASAQCCTSDISLAEFKQLQGRVDSVNPRAQTVEEFLEATAGIGSGETGTLMSHAESIALFKSLGVKMAPELKAAEVDMPFRGMSQATYAQKMIDEYKIAGVAPAQVFPQSFDLADIRYWLDHEPAFAAQAVYLDGRDANPDFDHRDPASWQPDMQALAAMGLPILAPPLWMLLDSDGEAIRPSAYALQAKAAGLDLIAWTLERSGDLRKGGGWYYQSVNGENPPPTIKDASHIHREGDVYRVLHVLATEVQVRGVFSDWPATVSYYAHCMNLP